MLITFCIIICLYIIHVVHVQFVVTAGDLKIDKKTKKKQ